MSDSDTLAAQSALDTAIDRVLRGESIRDARIDRGDLGAARFLAGAVEELLPSADTRGRVLRSVRERLQRPASRRRLNFGAMLRPGLALRGLAIAFLAAVLVVGSASALPVLLPDGFEFFHPSAVEILQSGRARELNLTQTVAGVTITADRAYADRERIVLQFTVQNPPADPAQTVPSPLHSGGSVTLRDASGRAYRIVRGVESPFISEARWTGQPLVGVYSFDASPLPADAERVSLELTISSLRGTGESTTRLPGPWRFTFDLPVLR